MPPPAVADGGRLSPDCIIEPRETRGREGRQRWKRLVTLRQAEASPLFIFLDCRDFPTHRSGEAIERLGSPSRSAVKRTRGASQMRKIGFHKDELRSELDNR